MVKLIEGRMYRGKLDLEVAYDVKTDIDTLNEREALYLWGYLVEDAKGEPVTGKDVRTSYVVGLAANEGKLYAITRNSAYMLVGDQVPKITTTGLLKPMWDELKQRIIAGNTEAPAPAVEHTFYKYPSTPQFRNALSTLLFRAKYKGRDENNEPIFGDIDPSLTKIQYVGTPKSHGTNGSIVQHADGKIEFFSKRQKLTAGENDNKGFAAFCTERMDAIIELLEAAKFHARCERIDVEYPVIISGEWMGSGVQSGAAVGRLEKMFMIFGVAFGVKDRGDRIDMKWAPVPSMKMLSYHDQRIYNAVDFGYYTVALDIENPEVAAEWVEGIAQDVEAECPIAKWFGIEDGIGEGVVWTPLDPELRINNDLWFKVKGDKHKSSKTKTLAPVDVEKMNSVNEFVDYALTRSRLDQAIVEVYGDSPVVLGPKVGEFMKWLSADVYKEEYDTLEVNGLTMKDVNKRISEVAKTYLFAVLK